MDKPNWGDCDFIESRIGRARFPWTPLSAVCIIIATLQPGLEPAGPPEPPEQLALALVFPSDLCWEAAGH